MLHFGNGTIVMIEFGSIYNVITIATANEDIELYIDSNINVKVNDCVEFCALNGKVVWVS